MYPYSRNANEIQCHLERSITVNPHYALPRICPCLCFSQTRPTYQAPGRHRTHQQRSEGSVITQQVKNGWDHGFPDLNAEILNPLSRVKMCFVTVTCVHQGSDLQHSWVSPESAPATHLLLNSFLTSFWERRLSVTVTGNLTNYIIKHIPSPILPSGRICF